MNKYADAGNFIGCVKAWNGGTNGLTERQSQLARITKVLQGAEWGAVTEAGIPTSKPPDPSPSMTGKIPAIEPTQPPPAWAAFFMAVLGLFKRGSK